MTQPSDMNYPPPQQDTGPYGQQQPAAQQQYPQQYPQYGTPQYGYGYPQQQFYMEPKHSGFGIASLIMGILVGLMELGLVVAAGMMAVKAGPAGMDEKAPETIALGL